MQIEETEVYTTKQVAEILKVSLPTIKRMLKDGRLKSTRIGRQHRFLGREILAKLEGEKGTSGAASNDNMPFQSEPFRSDQKQNDAAADNRQWYALQKNQGDNERRQQSYMLGKKLRSDIKDGDTVIFEKGSIITDEIIREAGKRKKLIEIFSNLEN